MKKILLYSSIGLLLVAACPCRPADSGQSLDDPESDQSVDVSTESPEFTEELDIDEISG